MRCASESLGSPSRSASSCSVRARFTKKGRPTRAPFFAFTSRARCGDAQAQVPSPHAASPAEARFFFLARRFCGAFFGGGGAAASSGSCSRSARSVVGSSVAAAVTSAVAAGAASAEISSSDATAPAFASASTAGAGGASTVAAAATGTSAATAGASTFFPHPAAEQLPSACAVAGGPWASAVSACIVAQPASAAPVPRIARVEKISCLVIGNTLASARNLDVGCCPPSHCQRHRLQHSYSNSKEKCPLGRDCGHMSEHVVIGSQGGAHRQSPRSSAIHGRAPGRHAVR